jgi:ABC-type amino acid transport substrate-binding protein
VGAGLPAIAQALAPSISATAVLDDVRARRALRVASTFDYRPFSYREAGALRGIDVDLAHALASALGVELAWVESTWKSLLDDLRANRFDIAMCGVSVTPERAAVGLFTNAYYHTGKSALARCDRIAQLRTIADIDKDGITVIVNPGGSNEAWARAHLSRARVVVHADNLSIFAALERGDADAMITDAVEGASEHRRHPSLCIDATAPFLEPIDKAWLVPNDPAWKAWLDAWLARCQSDGTLTLAIARNGAAGA